MARKDYIENLQDRIQHNRIADIDELKKDIATSVFADVDPYEDVLHPMGYNTCDRCGDIYDSETGFFWLDGFDWEVGNPKDEALQRALEEEPEEYCAICYNCLHDLEQIGCDILKGKV